MRLIYFSKAKLPSAQANSVHVMKMCAALAGIGNDVTLYAKEIPAGAERMAQVFAGYGVAPAFSIERVALPKMAHGKRIVYALRLRRALRRKKADAVIGRALYECLTAARMGIPTLFESHAPISDAGEGETSRFAKLIGLPAFRGLIVITHALEQWYLARYPQLAGRISVLPDAADVLPEDAASIELPERAAYRLHAGLIGHIYPGRGMELIEQVAPRCPDVCFHIVGGTPEDIALWKERCAAQTNIVFHGFVPPAEAMRYGLAMDLLLAPYQETVHTAGGASGGKGTGQWMSPMKVFEYMSCGKAILCSDRPVLREVLRDGENGLLLPYDDASAWETAINRLADDPKERERLGARARQDLAENYTWRKRAERACAEMED